MRGKAETKEAAEEKFASGAWGLVCHYSSLDVSVEKKP